MLHLTSSHPCCDVELVSTGSGPSALPGPAQTHLEQLEKTPRKGEDGRMQACFGWRNIWEKDLFEIEFGDEAALQGAPVVLMCFALSGDTLCTGAKPLKEAHGFVYLTQAWFPLLCFCELCPSCIQPWTEGDPGMGGRGCVMSLMGTSPELSVCPFQAAAVMFPLWRVCLHEVFSIHSNYSFLGGSKSWSHIPGAHPEARTLKAKSQG